MIATEIVDRFLLAAARAPDHPAVVDDGITVTYGALERRVRAFAYAFTTATSNEGPRVLIALPQCADAYAAILATGLAGGYHSPLNISAPIEKLARIARLFEPDFIVATGVLAANLSAFAPKAKLIDPASLDESAGLAGPGHRHALAYVIFTSGSTGLPKGVVIPRSALTHYVEWMTNVFGFTPDDRVAQHANLAFDISMTDIFGALCHGATLYPVSRRVDRLMPARMIERDKITIWNSVPSVISLMIQSGQVTAATLARVRLFNFCGEPLLPVQLEALFTARPDVLIRNTYGPTEATVSLTDLPLRADTWRRFSRTSIAIGPAIPGIGLHLIGGAHADEGEIVLTGPQLAQGYWRDEAKTAEVFRDVEVDGLVQRGYFTGDWAERHDGHIYFKERIDFQVKVKGFRIELDEVAAAIRDCGWPVVCVVKRGEALAAVVEALPEHAFDEAILLADLGRKLEPHAVPVRAWLIDRMPRNDNDKLDRNAVARWLDQHEADATQSRTKAPKA